MAPMKNLRKNYSNNCYGEAAAATCMASVLASCYLTNSYGSIKGFHYSTIGVTGLPSPPSSPPLAALVGPYDVTLVSKSKGPVTTSSKHRGRGGATLIREECERFFCETMREAFHGERNTAHHGSGAISVDMLTPPDDILDRRSQSNYLAVGKTMLEPTPVSLAAKMRSSRPDSPDAWRDGHGDLHLRSTVTAWMQILDYTNGTTIYAVVADDGDENALFVFFDEGIAAQELKPTLVALMDLADARLECSSIVLCVDRTIPQQERAILVKNLQWVGFVPTTMDVWANDIDITSNRWLCMAMEV